MSSTEDGEYVLDSSVVGYHGKSGSITRTTSQDPIATGPRLLGTLAIAAVTFSQVCGSPTGIEAAVGAGGAFGFSVALILSMFVWAIPQALIVAELSSAFPAAGGTVGWVEEGLGDILGFINAAMCQLSSISSLSVYPVLVSGKPRPPFFCTACAPPAFHTVLV
jgi:amino acid transporter